MDTNMKVRIVRDCLTTAKADLPDYMSHLWVGEMPVLEFHGSMAAESPGRHARIAAFRVAATRCRLVDLASDYAPDARITRVLVGECRVAVYCETNTGYAYKVVCMPLRDTTVFGPLSPCLMARVDTYAWGDTGWNMVIRDYANLV